MKYMLTRSDVLNNVRFQQRVQDNLSREIGNFYKYKERLKNFLEKDVRLAYTRVLNKYAWAAESALCYQAGKTLYYEEEDLQLRPEIVAELEDIIREGYKIVNQVSTHGAASPEQLKEVAELRNDLKFYSEKILQPLRSSNLPSAGDLQKFAELQKARKADKCGALNWLDQFSRVLKTRNEQIQKELQKTKSNATQVQRSQSNTQQEYTCTISQGVWVPKEVESFSYPAASVGDILCLVVALVSGIVTAVRVEKTHKVLKRAFDKWMDEGAARRIAEGID